MSAEKVKGFPLSGLKASRKVVYLYENGVLGRYVVYFARCTNGARDNFHGAQHGAQCFDVAQAYIKGRERVSFIFIPCAT